MIIVFPISKRLVNKKVLWSKSWNQLTKQCSQRYTPKRPRETWIWMSLLFPLVVKLNLKYVYGHESHSVYTVFPKACPDGVLEEDFWLCSFLVPVGLKQKWSRHQTKSTCCIPPLWRFLILLGTVGRWPWRAQTHRSSLTISNRPYCTWLLRTEWGLDLVECILLTRLELCRTVQYLSRWQHFLLPFYSPVSI